MQLVYAALCLALVELLACSSDILILKYSYCYWLLAVAGVTYSTHYTVQAISCDVYIP
jgi:hypothetical protein